MKWWSHLVLNTFITPYRQKDRHYNTDKNKSTSESYHKLQIKSILRLFTCSYANSWMTLLSGCRHVEVRTVLSQPRPSVRRIWKWNYSSAKCDCFLVVPNWLRREISRHHKKYRMMWRWYMRDGISCWSWWMRLGLKRLRMRGYDVILLRLALK